MSTKTKVKAKAKQPEAKAKLKVKKVEKVDIFSQFSDVVVDYQKEDYACIKPATKSKKGIDVINVITLISHINDMKSEYIVDVKNNKGKVISRGFSFTFLNIVIAKLAKKPDIMTKHSQALQDAVYRISKSPASMKCKPQLGFDGYAREGIYLLRSGKLTAKSGFLFFIPSTVKLFHVLGGKYSVSRLNTYVDEKGSGKRELISKQTGKVTLPQAVLACKALAETY